MSPIPSCRGSNQGGILALLDLPRESTLTLDGVRVLLKRDDFIGFRDIHIQSLPFNNHNHVHLITIHAGNQRKMKMSNESSLGITVGIVFLSDSLPLIRRYDPITEEVSSDAVDPKTTTNLIQSIKDGTMDLQQRVVSYSDFMTNNQLEHWNHLTRFISTRLLQQRNIVCGSKLIPGAYDDSDKVIGSTLLPMPTDDSTCIVDGNAVQYPPIPVLFSSNTRSTISSQPQHTMTTSHIGTKRFLAQRTPIERTTLFRNDNPASLVLDHLLCQEYDNHYEDLLGDLQLAYVLFVHLHCLASFVHWRDLIVMLSAISVEGLLGKQEIFTKIFEILYSQALIIESDFFDEFDQNDNFLMPAFCRLIKTSSSETFTHMHNLSAARRQFSVLLKNKFPNHFESDKDDEEEDGEARMRIVEETREDEDDAPIVVPAEEVVASMVRVSEMPKPLCERETLYSRQLREGYPILFAAMDATSEDVLMTCARALDEAKDVSLVREAAAYLEEVEARKM